MTSAPQKRKKEKKVVAFIGQCGGLHLCGRQIRTNSHKNPLPHGLVRESDLDA